jgi:tetratricopeptide (TPR) repeat protein
MSHLVDECPTCRAAFEAWRRESGERAIGANVHEYDDAFERVRRQLSPHEGEGSAEGGQGGGFEARVEKDRAVAEALAAELMAASRRDRLERLRDFRDDCPPLLLADALIERAKGYLPGQPEESFEAADLARAALQRERPDTLSCEIYARALAHQANARRVQGQLRQADDLMDVARYLLRAQGGGDRLTRAEMDRFTGGLRCAQRRFADAESMYSRAMMAYALEGENVDVARILLSLSIAYREMAEFDRAIEATSQALEILSEQDHPRLRLYAQHNMVSFLVEDGQVREAEELFAEIRDLYALFSDPLSSLRRIWLEGHLARGRKDFEAAVSHYEAVRTGFMSRGIGYDAALVALDLATLYAEQGRTAELKKIAEEIVPVFEAQDVHREAAAALMLFQDAVRTEQVTLGYVLELTRYLQRARLDPALQFRVPT